MRRLAFALALGGVAALLAATQPLSDTDMWWHLATGRETLANGFVRTDVFSWSVAGLPVSTDQWLGQVVMWLAYQVLGWHGVAALRALLVAVLITLVTLGAMRGSSRPLAVVLAIVPALLLTRAVWVDRPELMGFVFFAALLVMLRRFRDAPRRSTVVGIAALIGLWANLHGSFALGVVLIAIVCIEGAIRDPLRRNAYVACAVGAFAVTLVNPAGIGVWTAPGSHFLSPPRDIQEWNVVDVRTALGLAYVATLAVVLACVFLGPRVPLRDVAILVPVAFLSLTAARQAPLLAIVAAPLIADRADLLLDRVGLARSAPPGLSPRVLAFAPSLALLAIALAIAPSRPDEHAYPADALASLPTRDHVLARYEWGGWLIWSGLPVYVDGRLTPYAGDVLADYKRVIAAAPNWYDIVAKRHVSAILVAPTDPVAVRAAELGWQVVFRSDDAVIIAVR